MTTTMAPVDAIYSRHIVTQAWRFVQRWDLYAQQLDDGRYICVREPLTIRLLLAHLKGEITLGAYILDLESRARFIVLDTDDQFGFDRLLSLAKTLALTGVVSYVEESRRGGHLWLFFTRAVSGERAREFGKGILTVHQVENMELFPKQDKLVEGPGSLIRMPFGIHRRVGRRYGFYNHEGQPLAPTIREQIEVLSDPEKVSEALFMAYRSNTPLKPIKGISGNRSNYTDIATQIKNRARVLEFVGRYVELKPIGNGSVGLCPFHDDQYPSFGVNDRDNYWNCFAGCGGGSIIDFWMKWRDCDFAVAVNELAQMLL
jgi:hypothetical protein